MSEPGTRPPRPAPHVARHTRPQLDPLPAVEGLPAGRPRSPALRTVCGLGSVAVLLVPQVMVPFGFLGTIGALGADGTSWRTLGYMLLTCAFVPVLRRVSYRRRDWLVLTAVPIWQWVLAFRVGYRLAFLPYRDWPPRPDEVVAARRIRGARLWVLPAGGGPRA